MTEFDNNASAHRPRHKPPGRRRSRVRMREIPTRHASVWSPAEAKRVSNLWQTRNKTSAEENKMRGLNLFLQGAKACCGDKKGYSKLQSCNSKILFFCHLRGQRSVYLGWALEGPNNLECPCLIYSPGNKSFSLRLRTMR
jgi:hypothetical protein